MHDLNIATKYRRTGCTCIAISVTVPHSVTPINEESQHNLLTFSVAGTGLPAVIRFWGG